MALQCSMCDNRSDEDADQHYLRDRISRDSATLALREPRFTSRPSLHHIQGNQESACKENRHGEIRERSESGRDLQNIPMHFPDSVALKRTHARATRWNVRTDFE